MKSEHEIEIVSKYRMGDDIKKEYTIFYFLQCKKCKRFSRAQSREINGQETEFFNNTNESPCSTRYI